MPRKLGIIAVLVALATGVTGLLVADDSSSSRPQDEAAIRAASQAFAQAFEKGDAARSRAFTEEAHTSRKKASGSMASLPWQRRTASSLPNVRI